MKLLLNCVSKTQRLHLMSSLTFIVSLMVILSGCNEQNIVSEQPTGFETRSSAVTESVTELPGISFQSLLEIAATLATNGVDLLSPILDALDVPGDITSVYLRTLKVSTTYPHPNGSGEMIDISGVMIVPAETTDSLRFVISPVPTYTENSSAPSNIFAGEVPLLYEDFFNYLYFVALNAVQGCAIFMPDYPGFGDSYGQCFHPFLIKESLLGSTIALAQVAREALTSYGYTYKREALVAGYSQGGYVATAVGRELDLNGEAYNLPISSMLVGGVPADLNTILTIARQTLALPLALIFPYTVLGYKENVAPELDLSVIFNSPYDETCYTYLDGQHSSVEVVSAFPMTNIGLFTPYVLLNDTSNPTIARQIELLAENSLEPWVNTVPVVFIHSPLDESIYYANIVNYIDQMTEIGGTPELRTSLLQGHLITMTDYFVELFAYLAEYK